MTLFERLLDEEPPSDHRPKTPEADRIIETTALAAVLMESDESRDAYEHASQTAFLEQLAHHAYQAPDDLIAAVSASPRVMTKRVLRPWMWIGGVIALAAAIGALYVGIGRPIIVPVSAVPTAAAPPTSYAVPAGNATMMPSVSTDANHTPVPTAKEGPEPVPPKHP